MSGHQSDAPRHVGRVLRRAGVGLLLIGAPSLLTVLRHTTEHLNADGVQQSTMSVQGVSLFYWGQDRLVPVVSMLASPISDPTVNLWACLFLQAASFYGLLLLIAWRTAAALSASTPHATTVIYLALVAGVNCVMSPAMIHSYALEGQPYALSWLLMGLAYEAWKRGQPYLLITGGLLSFVALGLNPSVVLLALFLAATDMIRRRRFVRWVGFAAAQVLFFIGWSYLASRYGTFSTPARVPSPSYLGFSVSDFQSGFATVLNNIVVRFQPVRSASAVLLALLATVFLSPPRRAKVTLYGSFFTGFTLLYLAVFAGNNWVLMNGYHFRYFFPLPLLIVMAVAIPVALIAIEIIEPSPISRRDKKNGLRVTAPLLALVGTCALLTLVGPVRAPQHADVLRVSASTADYAEANDVRFISGSYWNMWPLMHQLLEQSRDGVLVAGFKSGGQRRDYQAALDDQLATNGSVEALCINDTASLCQGYLDYWTRPGWQQTTDQSCPAPPDLRSPEAIAAGETCIVMRYNATG